MTQITGRDKFRKAKRVIYFFVSLAALFPRSFSSYLLLKIRNVSGNFGLVLRYVLLKVLCKECGDNVSIHPGVFLFNVKNLCIGENVSIHPMCYIDSAGGISIGDNVSIAHNTTLISSNHTWDNLSIPIKYNVETLKTITIEDDVWIGCGCRILSGVTIYRRTVVAAGAVVNKSFSSNCILAGVPAKAIKSI